MRSVLIRSTCVFLAMLLVSLGQSHAGVIVSNLGDTVNGHGTICGSGPPQEYAQEFTTGSQSVTLGLIIAPSGGCHAEESG